MLINEPIEFDRDDPISATEKDLEIPSIPDRCSLRLGTEGLNVNLEDIVEDVTFLETGEQETSSRLGEFGSVLFFYFYNFKNYKLNRKYLKKWLKRSIERNLGECL